MTAHYHLCNLCPAGGQPCDEPGCWTEPQMDGRDVIQVGKPRACSSCAAPLDAIASEPDPTRGELSGAALVRCVARATRAGLASPSDATVKFADYIDPLAPADPTMTDHDTWYRLGCVIGAKSAWAADLQRGPEYRVPPDCPHGEPGACFVAAWNASVAVVLQIRMEVASRG